MGSKQILTSADLAGFHETDVFKSLFSFIQCLNSAATDKPRTNATQTETNLKLATLIKTLKSLVSKYPPIENNNSRFGNPSFRMWFDHVSDNITDLLTDLNLIPKNQIQNLSFYLANSFGNRTRIDYGTGHELNFMAFLFCLQELGVIVSDDFEGLVLVVFWDYILLMRLLQQTYWLEPAGSHGVWGLDDYQFLPFLFGSAQLISHKYLRPKSVLDNEILEEFKKDYIYFDCIMYINSIKTETLGWHSPMLNDISIVKKWSKVNEGMLKMYMAEVLSKLPIMQHFEFGNLIKFESLSVFPVEDEHRHVFAFGQEFPTCCGMRIPSAVAASMLKGEKGEMRTVEGSKKPLPFD